MRGHGDKGLQVSTSRPLHHPNSPDAPPPLTTFPGLCPPPRAPSAGLPSGHLPSLLLTLSLILQLPPSTGTFQEAQSRLNEAAAGLNQAATELVQASRGTPQDLARASGRFGQDFSTFLEAGVEMAGQAPVGRGAGYGSRVRGISVTTES